MTQLEKINKGISEGNPLSYCEIVNYITNSYSSKKEIIDNMFSQANEGNPFAMKKISNWYHDGTMLEQSDADYYIWLEKIIDCSIAKNTLRTLQDYDDDPYCVPSLYIQDAWIFSDPIGYAAEELGKKHMLLDNKNDLISAKWYFDKAILCHFDCYEHMDVVNKKINAKNGKHPIQEIHSLPDKVIEVSKYNQKELGEKVWNNLSDISQIYLNTALFAYSQLTKMNESEKSMLDYSIVVSPLMRALEYELKLRIFDQYVEYIHEKFPNVDDFFSYNSINSGKKFEYTSFIYHNKNIKTFQFKDYGACTFMLGSIKYIYGLSQDVKTKKYSLDKSAEDFLSVHLNKSPEEWYSSLYKDVESIRILRNTSSHGGSTLILEDANWAIDFLLKTKKILVKLIETWI